MLPDMALAWDDVADMRVSPKCCPYWLEIKVQNVDAIVRRAPEKDRKRVRDLLSPWGQGTSIPVGRGLLGQSARTALAQVTAYRIAVATLPGRSVAPEPQVRKEARDRMR
jgi:hypothetical protein